MVRRKTIPEVFHAAAPDAAEVLIGILDDKDAPLSFRIKCAEIILNRAYGKPRQTVEVEAGHAPQVVFIGGDRIRD